MSLMKGVGRRRGRYRLEITEHYSFRVVYLPRASQLVVGEQHSLIHISANELFLLRFAKERLRRLCLDLH